MEADGRMGGDGGGENGEGGGGDGGEGGEGGGGGMFAAALHMLQSLDDETRELLPKMICTQLSEQC